MWLTFSLGHYPQTLERILIMECSNYSFVEHLAVLFTFLPLGFFFLKKEKSNHGVFGLFAYYGL
jgi:hypothetical protein